MHDMIDTITFTISLPDIQRFRKFIYFKIKKVYAQNFMRQSTLKISGYKYRLKKILPCLRFKT